MPGPAQVPRTAVPGQAGVSSPDGAPARPAARSPWADSMDALALFAVDPHGLGGVLLRARAGPVQSQPDPTDPRIRLDHLDDPGANRTRAR